MGWKDKEHSRDAPGCNCAFTYLWIGKTLKAIFAGFSICTQVTNGQRQDPEHLFPNTWRNNWNKKTKWETQHIDDNIFIGTYVSRSGMHMDASKARGGDRLAERANHNVPSGEDELRDELKWNGARKKKKRETASWGNKTDNISARWQVQLSKP